MKKVSMHPLGASVYLDIKWCKTLKFAKKQKFDFSEVKPIVSILNMRKVKI
jgi:hypothetical protein